MHVYKDAIHGIVTSIALYPACGTKTMEFFSDKGDSQISIQGIGSIHWMIGEENGYFDTMGTLDLTRNSFCKGGNPMITKSAPSAPTSAHFGSPLR